MKYQTPIVITVNQHKTEVIGNAFAQGCGAKVEKNPKSAAGKFICTLGVMYGTAKYLKEAKDFLYIDHGYLGKGSPALFNGYYRIVYNSILHDIKNIRRDHSWEKFEKFNRPLQPWKKHGSHIIIAPPTTLPHKNNIAPMSKFLGLNPDQWLKDTIAEIKKYSDRKIIICTKCGSIKLQDVLPNAWTLVTDHSNAQVDALIAGIPVITTSPMRKIGTIRDNIESPIYERDFLKDLVHYQWTVSEMKSGQAWKEINEETE